jgi:hypothetical protein
MTPHSPALAKLAEAIGADANHHDGIVSEQVRRTLIKFASPK